MARTVYGGPTWQNTGNLLGSGQGMVTPAPPGEGGWGATPWQNTGNLLGSSWVGARPPAPGAGYRGGSRWPVTHPYGQVAPSTPSWNAPPRALPWVNQDNPLATGSAPWRATSATPATPAGYTASTRPVAVQPGANVPVGVQELGLGGWYERFTQQHGGQTPEQYYGQHREGLAEALGDLEWSRGFQGMYGRPPTEDDWKAWYFQSRGGGNFGARDLYRDVKGMSDQEYRRALKNAGSEAERRQLKKYRASIERARNIRSSGSAESIAEWRRLFDAGELAEGKEFREEFVREYGMTPEQYYGAGGSVPGVTGPVNGVSPAPGSETAEEYERRTGEPTFGIFPVDMGPDGYPLERPARAPLWQPPQVYWQVR